MKMIINVEIAPVLPNSNVVTRALGKIARQVESAGFRKWVSVWRFARRMDNSDAR